MAILEKQAQLDIRTGDLRAPAQPYSTTSTSTDTLGQFPTADRQIIRGQAIGTNPANKTGRVLGAELPQNLEQLSTIDRTTTGGTNTYRQTIGEAAVRPNSDRVAETAAVAGNTMHVASPTIPAPTAGSIVIEPRILQPVATDGGSPRSAQSSNNDVAAWTAPDRFSASAGNIQYVDTPRAPGMDASYEAAQASVRLTPPRAQAAEGRQIERFESPAMEELRAERIAVTPRIIVGPDYGGDQQAVEQRRQIVTQEQRFSAVMHALNDNFYVNRGVTENRIQSLAGHTDDSCAVKIIRTGSSHGPLTCDQPAEVIAGIVTHYMVSMAAESKPIIVVELSGAEMAKPGMSPLEREMTHRKAFAAIGLVNAFRIEAGMREIEVLIDADVKADPMFAAVKKDLQYLQRVTFPRQFEEACIAETIRRIEGKQYLLHSIWSSASNPEHLQLAREGCVSNKTLVPNEPLGVDNVLALALRDHVATFALKPGRSLIDGVPGVTSPDVVIPQPRHKFGSPLNAPSDHRIKIGDPEEQLRQHLPNLVEAQYAGDELKQRLAHQKYFYEIGKLVNQAVPGFIPRAQDATRFEMLRAHIQDCQTAVRRSNTEKNVARLRAATLLTGTAQNDITVHALQHLSRVLHPDVSLAQLAGRTSVAVPSSYASQEAVYPTLSEDSFSEEHQPRMAGTRTKLNTIFKGRGFRPAANASAPALPEEKTLVPAIFDSSDGDNGGSDNDDIF